MSENLTTLSVDELAKRYRDAVSTYRYYADTDDLANWNREKSLRESSRKNLDELSNEYQRRGIPTPKC